MSTPVMLRSVDVFCAVVDNYGDAGFCWRLSRILAFDHGLAVRLWIDRPAVLARMVPGVDPARETQVVSAVTIVRWHASAMTRNTAALPDAVFETFGCGLPDAYLQAMEGAPRRPAWINIEHLSAEAWVRDYHGLPSPQPRGTLLRHFFFPGFDADTGGLLREADLFDRRDAFMSEPAQRRRLFGDLGVTQATGHPITLSLFAYSHPRIPELLDAWSSGDTRVLCLVPQGSLDGELSAWAGIDASEPAWRIVRGNLELASIPFTDQDRYDALLWACDFNVVRGEDSFVRAQWAARPLVWQAYRQDQDSHRAKVSAFSARYTKGLEPNAAAAWNGFIDAWNSGAPIAVHWPPLLRHARGLREHARAWAEHCRGLPELSRALVEFAARRV